MAGVFYGWWVTLAFSVMVFLSTGVRFSVGPFLKPMVADLHTDRATYSLIVSLSLFLYGAYMPFIGRLVDRLGVRPVAIMGTALFAGAIAATGLVQDLLQLTVIYGVILALGLSATGHVVGSAAVSRWFVRRRATALSVLGAASMAGMSLLVPVTMWLVLKVGWRLAYGILGLAALVILLPLTLWLVRESPESLGLHPDGDAPAGRVLAADDERTGIRVATRSLPFWQLSGGMFTCGFSMSLLSAHGVPMLTDHGYPAMLASWALGLLGASSMVLAVVLGRLADRFGRRPVLAWLYATRALLFGGLFFVHDSPAALLLLAAMGGSSMGGSLAMTSALTADIFGRFSVGTVFGTIFFVHQGGAALGSWLGGFLFEATGGYGPAFAVASGQLVLGALLSLTIDGRRRPMASLSPTPQRA